MPPPTCASWSSATRATPTAWSLTTMAAPSPPTAAGDWVSAGTVSKGEYAVPAGLVFSYPCTGDGKGNFTPVAGVRLDAFGQQKFQASLAELQEEREAVQDLLQG